MEKWKDVPGFEGHQISDFGRARSFRKNAEGSIQRLEVKRGRDKRVVYNVVVFWRNNKKIRKTVHRLVYELFVGPLLKNRVIDHIDGDGLNNKASNLRISTFSQNSSNKRKNRGSYSSQYKGVSFNRQHKTWIASIGIRRQSIYLGWFDTEIEAARAYNEAAILHHGEFAHLNILPQEVH